MTFAFFAVLSCASTSSPWPDSSYWNDGRCGVPVVGGVGARPRVRVVIGLGDGDLLVAVVVGRAAQARHEVMREHRAGERARFLRELVGAAAREQHHARQLRAIDVDLELVDARAALARDRAGLARVDHRELDRRRHRAQRVAQLLERQRIAAQVDLLVIGVTRVIEEDERVFGARSSRCA